MQNDMFRVKVELVVPLMPLPAETSPFLCGKLTLVFSQNALEVIVQFT